MDIPIIDDNSYNYVQKHRARKAQESIIGSNEIAKGADETDESTNVDRGDLADGEL